MNPLRTVYIPDSQNHCLNPYALWSSMLVYYIPSFFLDLISNHFLERRSGLHLSVIHEGFVTKCAGFSSWHLICAKQMRSSSNSWSSKPWLLWSGPGGKSLLHWIVCPSEPACGLYLPPPALEWIAKSSSSVFPNHFLYLFLKEEISSYNKENNKYLSNVLQFQRCFMCLLSCNSHGNPVK